MQGKVFAVVLVGFVAAVLAAALPAFADQPAVTLTHIDRTRTIPAGPDFCPFPFVVHTEGTLRDVAYSSGTAVEWAVDFHITYTNPATGESVGTTLAGPFVVEPNGDGTVTVTINGNDGLVTAPGQGVLWAEIGRLVYIADPSDVFTPLQVLQSTGQQDPLEFPAVCAGLS